MAESGFKGVRRELVVDVGKVPRDSHRYLGRPRTLK